MNLEEKVGSYSEAWRDLRVACDELQKVIIKELVSFYKRLFNN